MMGRSKPAVGSKKVEPRVSPRHSAGPATSTPAVKSTKRKRPVMPSPGLSPLKLRDEIEHSMVLKPPDQPHSSEDADTDDFFSAETSQDSSCANELDLPTYSTDHPSKRRRRKREVSANPKKSMNVAVEELRDKVKDHFKEIEDFPLDFV